MLSLLLFVLWHIASKRGPAGIIAHLRLGDVWDGVERAGGKWVGERQNSILQGSYRAKNWKKLKNENSRNLT